MWECYWSFHLTLGKTANKCISNYVKQFIWWWSFALIQIRLMRLTVLPIRLHCFWMSASPFVTTSNHFRSIYLATVRFSSGKDNTPRPPRGYCTHTDKWHVLCEERRGSTDAGTSDNCVRELGAMAEASRNWCTQETPAPRNISADLIPGLKLLHQRLRGGIQRASSWPAVVNDESEHWGKFESHTKMLVSWTRLGSRREYLKMRTVMSRLPQLMMTALEDTLFARLFIFRLFFFLVCTVVTLKGASHKKTWHTWQDDVLVNIVNRLLWWAVSQERSLSCRSHLSGNFYLCIRD